MLIKRNQDASTRVTRNTPQAQPKPLTCAVLLNTIQPTSAKGG
jgi:hypothetical protein